MQGLTPSANGCAADAAAVGPPQQREASLDACEGSVPWDRTGVARDACEGSVTGCGAAAHGRNHTAKECWLKVQEDAANPKVNPRGAFSAEFPVALCPLCASSVSALYSALCPLSLRRLGR